MGTHGHTGFKDLIFGTTVNKLRHKISIPLLIVKKNSVLNFSIRAISCSLYLFLLKKAGKGYRYQG
jgi:hypothetical protein